MLQSYQNPIARLGPIVDRMVQCGASKATNPWRAGLPLSANSCINLLPSSVLIFVAVCISGLLCLVLTSFAEFARTEWQLSKPVEAKIGEGYLRVSIDGEVYRRSQASLADLRLVDDLG